VDGGIDTTASATHEAARAAIRKSLCVGRAAFPRHLTIGNPLRALARGV
jgi:hypothetical protein